MRRMAVVLGVLAAHGVARGSGSVALEIADERCRITIQQTFRKILDGDYTAYVEGVRRDFAHRATALLPAIERALGKRTPFDVAAPVIVCGELPCAGLAGAAFPATVLLPPIALDGGHELVVGVTFTKPPGAAALAAQRAKLEAAIKPVVGERPETALSLAALPAVDRQGASYTLRVHAGLDTTERAGGRHRARLDAAAATHQARLDRLQATPPPGLTLVPCRAEVRSWEGSGHKLPARFSRVVHGDLSSTEVTVCVGSMDAKDTVDRALEAVLAR